METVARKVLVVDDEGSILQSLKGVLEDEGYEVQVCQSGGGALHVIQESAFDLVMLDIRMPGMDGITTLQKMREMNPEIPVVMMSGHGTIETAVKTTKLGAYDYVEKPLSVDKVLLTVRHALDELALKRENRGLQENFKNRYQMIGESPPMEELKRQIGQVAPTDSSVLITGENGTGKELVARNIHHFSSRANHPFVEVNCAAIPEELIESELFGHEKGAFTGAVARRRGKFDLADKGTIFLDEIGDMSLKTQAKILRILQEKRFERVGGKESIQVDVRVIAATNKKLEQEMAHGKFREDLYYRLNVIPFHIPPLRERKEDIPVFIDYFLKENGSLNLPVKISPEGIKALMDYHWPGNVRELKNLMERITILSPSETIQRKDLLPWLRKESPGGNPRASRSLEEARRLFEKEFIENKLIENRYNISRTAEVIQISRENLSRKMKALGIRVERIQAMSQKFQEI
ncbi:MAG: sigma-54-dependent Fis family transcriptional regulator [Deltaproteobacteria bacterium]|nr:sigma-54-dependent Fis family transcriptional regulator [Deltaproteobacteria bacterium]